MEFKLFYFISLKVIIFSYCFWSLPLPYPFAARGGVNLKNWLLLGAANIYCGASRSIHGSGIDYRLLHSVSHHVCLICFIYIHCMLPTVFYWLGWLVLLEVHAFFVEVSLCILMHICLFSHPCQWLVFPPKLLYSIVGKGLLWCSWCE